MENELFFIYETTNLINGKKYRGIHKTNNLKDGYIGSGLAFEKAVEKYGKENFKRDILEFCSSYDELIEKEKIYVDEDWVKNKNNYNIKTGGQSAGILSKESKRKISKTLKNKYQSGEIVASIGEKRKGKAPWNKGIQMSEDFKKKCSESGKDRFKNDENHPLKINGNKECSTETKEKISKTLKEAYMNGDRIANKESKTEDFKNKVSETLKTRYKNQEHHSKGKPSWNKGREMKKIECPYCNKLVDSANGKRWHFENCKFKTPS